MSTEINSELFGSNNSYVIFISKESANFFSEEIKKQQYNHLGVEVLKANFQDDLAVIVIPIRQNFQNIEKRLFEFKSNSEIPELKNSGFWGQIGMGYEGKTWSV